MTDPDLCPKPLRHGVPCGREIDLDHGLGLCLWHSEEVAKKPHADDDDVPCPNRNFCTRCNKRPVAYRVSRLCGNCHKVMHRQNVVESGKRSKRL